jgi:hypothetical protein
VVIIASKICRAASLACLTIIVVNRNRSAALIRLGQVRAEHHQDRRRAFRDAAGGGDVDGPAVALGVAVAQLRLDDHRWGGVAGGRVGDQHHHVGEVLHRDDRAHVGRGQGDGHPAGKSNACGAPEEVHGDLGVLADQVQRSLVWY